MKKNIFQKMNTSSSGFTLLEMLFAVIIFSFALVSLMTIAGRGVVATATAKDQLTAQFLAEELIEVARNMRDANFVNQQDWLSAVEDCDDGCDAEYYTASSPQLIPCENNDVCTALYNNNGQYRPNNDNGNLSLFSRNITVERIGDNHAKLVATVNWRQRTVNRTYTVQTYFTNWQADYSE